MHDMLVGYVERGEIPGLVALVSRRGDTHVEVIGAKSIGGEPVRRDSVFRISSMTKPVHRCGDDNPGRGLHAAPG
jgi:CubicO group peptidase (beta-lactamase class C family)